MRPVSIVRCKQRCKAHTTFHSDGQLDHIHIASFLLYYVAKRHCFTDGNKRVAWAVAVDYFLQQGLQIVATQEEAAKLVEDVACDIVSKEDIIRWFGTDNRLQEVGVE